MAIYRDPAERFALAESDATRSVELWTVERLPFETEQEGHEKEMVVQHVAPAIRRIAWSHREVLHATFASDDRGGWQPDAENITFYNFGDKPFESAPFHIRFERSSSSAPPCPAVLSEPPPYYHQWEPASRESGFRYWMEQEPLAEWTRMVCVDVTGDKGARRCG